MAVASYASSSPPIQQHLQPAVQEEKIDQADIPVLNEPVVEELISWGDLCGCIIEQINSNEGAPFDAEALAMNIVITNPDSLTPLSLFQLKEVYTHVAAAALAHPEIPVGKILAVSRELFTLSLQNSRYYKIANNLETNIRDYVFLTEKPNLNRLIRSSTKLLEIIPEEDLSEIEQLKQTLGQASSEISEILQIGVYVDPKEYLALKTMIANGPFPTCVRGFPRLVQNLSIARNEFSQLATLIRQIHPKQLELVEAAKPLYAAQSSADLSEEKELFFNGYFNLFWKAGEKVIHDAFQETFAAARKNTHFILPKELKRAINKTKSQIANGESYILKTVLHQAPQIHDAAYIGTLFSEFGGENPEGLMRRYLHSLPDDWFKELQAKIKGSKTPEKELEKAFLNDVGAKQLTFISLKKWCLSNSEI